MSMPRNSHKVPLRQWRKWSARARFVFNELYSTMKANQHLFLHPHQDKISRQLWKTVAWNSAWVAADAVREHERAEKSKQAVVRQKGGEVREVDRRGRETGVVHKVH